MAHEGSRQARPRGRRPAGENTRAALLDAARKEFTERGFDGATVRTIAQRAGMDPAMVNHWFGGKDALFVAALQLPVDPEDIIRRVLDGPAVLVFQRPRTLFVRFNGFADRDTVAQAVANAASLAS